MVVTTQNWFNFIHYSLDWFKVQEPLQLATNFVPSTNSFHPVAFQARTTLSLRVHSKMDGEALKVTALKSLISLIHN